MISVDLPAVKYLMKKKAKRYLIVTGNCPVFKKIDYLLCHKLKHFQKKKL